MVLTRRRVRLCAVVLAVLMAGAAVVVAVWRHDYPVRHFAVVQRDVLYRSAQPDEAGWKRLRDHYGIRTVIDVREDAPDAPWAVLEKRFCRENGIRHLKLSIGSDYFRDEQLRVMIQTISDPKCQPVLVHCEYGKSRTGIAVAAYRVAAQGWSYQAALAESQKFKKNMEPGYVAYLKELADGKGWRPSAPAAAVGFDARKAYP